MLFNSYSLINVKRNCKTKVLYNPYKQLLSDACNICHLLFTVIDNNNCDKYMH